MPTLDKATLEAVRGTKKEAHATLSHRRQLARNRARKKANLEVIAARTKATKEVVRSRQEAAVSIAANRERIRAERIVNPPQRSIGSRVRERATTSTFNTVASTATPSSNSGLIMTTIFLMAGLIIVYNLITKADQFSGFVGSAGDFLHKLSSTTPLFQTVST